MCRWWCAWHVLAGWEEVQVVEGVDEILGLDELGGALLLRASSCDWGRGRSST